MRIGMSSQIKIVGLILCLLLPGDTEKHWGPDFKNMLEQIVRNQDEVSHPTGTTKEYVAAVNTKADKFTLSLRLIQEINVWIEHHESDVLRQAGQLIEC